MLREIVTATIESFAWPKSMRWGSGAMRWVRPLQNVLCLFDGAVVDVALRVARPARERVTSATASTRRGRSR